MNDAVKLAGVGLGTMLTNILGIEFLAGINGASSTLISQAYGAGNVRICGIYLNRGRCVLTAFFIPLFIILVFSK